MFDMIVTVFSAFIAILVTLTLIACLITGYYIVALLLVVPFILVWSFVLWYNGVNVVDWIKTKSK